MTSPAIKLAKECNVKWHPHISTAVTVYEFYPNELIRFYALAQAQALEIAAEKCLDGFFAAELLRMTEELRRGA